MSLPIRMAMVAGGRPRDPQQVLTYRLAENRVRKAQLDGRRLRLTDPERWRRAALAHRLRRKRLQEIATLATPDTLLRWSHHLIAQQCDGSTHRRQRGRPRGAAEIAPLVVRMAEEHPPWGSRRLQGALANLGHRLDAITGRNRRRRHHREPAPQRRKAGMAWAPCLKLPWAVWAATDCFTVEVATWHGWVTYSGLCGLALASRRLHSAGITPHPPVAFRPPGARPLTNPLDGFLLGQR
jgi:hypothetical protein